MDTLWPDLRIGLRQLTSRPGFSAIAILTLALGIGANTAVFSVVHAVLLRPLPYQDSEGLLRVSERRQGPLPPIGAILTNNTYHAWMESNQTLEGLAAYTARSFTMTEGGAATRVRGSAVSASLFPMLRVTPATGRLFTAAEEPEGSNLVALVSHMFWRGPLASDPQVLGRSLTLDDRTYTIVGVMPPSFAFPDDDVQVWIPYFVPLPSTGNQRFVYALSALARLAPGRSLEEARAEGATILARLSAEEQRPMGGGPPALNIAPLEEELVRDVRPALLVLQAAVVLVLLVAAANLANLLLARAASRAREMAVRAAIGAGRLRLVRQLLTESLLLAVIGGLAGLVVAWWLVRLLPMVAPEDIPRIDTVNVDAVVLMFTALVAVGSGLLFGLAPAVHAARVDLSRALVEGAMRATSGFRFARGNRVRPALAAAEIAVALVLLVGAGLLMKSFIRLVDVDPGYDPANVITAEITLPAARYGRPFAAAGFFDQLFERLNDSRIEAVAASASLPLMQGEMIVAFSMGGRDANPDAPPATASVRIVTPDYLSAMGIRLRAGRALAPTDVSTSQSVILVNEAFVREYLPDRDPVGQQIPLFQSPAEIVGVIGDVRHRGLDAEPRPEVYVPFQQSRNLRAPSAYLVARTIGDPLAVVPAIRDAVQAIDASVPVDRIATMEQRVSASVARPRFYALLVALFSTLAATLACVGLYGVMSYGVLQRTREIGVRMALGADRLDILRLVLRQSAWLIGAGVLVGLAGAAIASRSLGGLLFGVTPADLTVYAGVALLLAACALAACYVPARRASAVQPSQALRYE